MVTEVDSGGKTEVQGSPSRVPARPAVSPHALAQRMLSVMRTCRVLKQFRSAPLCQSLGKGLAFTVLGDAKSVRAGGCGEGRVEEEGDESATPQDLL